MKAKLIVMSLLLGAAYAIPAVAAANRFDGIWVGTENVNGQEFRGGSRVSAAIKKPAKIAIAEGGTVLAVVDGYGPGRYMDIRRDGNTIIFRAGHRRVPASVAPHGHT